MKRIFLLSMALTGCFDDSGGSLGGDDDGSSDGTVDSASSAPDSGNETYSTGATSIGTPTDDTSTNDLDSGDSETVSSDGAVSSSDGNTASGSTESICAFQETFDDFIAWSNKWERGGAKVWSPTGWPPGIRLGDSVNSLQLSPLTSNWLRSPSFTVAEDSVLTFWMWASIAVPDRLVVLIDDDEVQEYFTWGGSGNLAHSGEIPVSPGDHTLEFRYERLGGEGFYNRVYIDELLVCPSS